MAKKLIAILLIVCFIFAGCGAQENGGGSGLNLKGITVTPVSDDEANIVLSFISGSRNANITEGSVSMPPKYEATYLEAPARIELKLYGVDYADFESVSENAFIYGVFAKAATETEPYTLYIQLKASKSYEIKSNGANIEINIKKGEMLTGKSYVLWNVYGSEEEESARALGFTPTLTSDLKNIVMISGAFNSESDAQAFIDKNAETFNAFKTLPYVSTPEGELPTYNVDSDIEGLKLVDMILTEDGETITLPSIYTGARFVCSSKAGKTVYAKTIQPDYTQDVEQVTRETLFIEGERAQILESKQFYSIAKAAFSEDGRYIAILDNSASASILYLYDCVSETLKNIGEEGFGEFTTSFVWSGNTVYAMTGDTVFGLMSYDTATGKVSAIEEREGAISDIAIIGDNIYFCDGGKVLAVNTKTSVRSEFANGVFVTASNGGKLLAVLEQVGGEEELFSIKVYDVENKKEYTVAENIIMQDMAFVGGTLYATIPAETAGEFAYKLVEFKNGAVSTVGSVLTEKIEEDAANGALIFIYSKYFGGSEYTGNYRYSA